MSIIYGGWEVERSLHQSWWVGVRGVATLRGRSPSRPLSSTSGSNYTGNKLTRPDFLSHFNMITMEGFEVNSFFDFLRFCELPVRYFSTGTLSSIFVIAGEQVKKNQVLWLVTVPSNRSSHKPGDAQVCDVIRSDVSMTSGLPHVDR